MLGKLDKTKGVYDLLSVIPRVIDTINDAMFYICGNGDIAPCKKIVDEYEVGNNVVIKGWQGHKQCEELLKKCCVFVLPSYHEGMPMALLEAMSYGLAPISTNVGSIPRVIDQGINGVMIGAGNKEELYTQFVSLLKDENKRKAWGEAARIKVQERFDAKIMVDKLVGIYRSEEMG